MKRRKSLAERLEIAVHEANELYPMDLKRRQEYVEKRIKELS